MEQSTTPTVKKTKSEERYLVDFKSLGRGQVKVVYQLHDDGHGRFETVTAYAALSNRCLFKISLSGGKPYFSDHEENMRKINKLESQVVDILRGLPQHVRDVIEI